MSPGAKLRVVDHGPIPQRLAHMHAVHHLEVIEVGDGARHTQHAMIRAGTEVSLSAARTSRARASGSSRAAGAMSRTGAVALVRAASGCVPAV